MKFNSIAELVSLAQEHKVGFGQIMLAQEMSVSGLTQAKVYRKMQERYQVMRQAVEAGLEGVVSNSGLTGLDAPKMQAYLMQETSFSSQLSLTAVAYALATNEQNAAMGVICATPTAGSAGVLPGVLLALEDHRGYSEEEIIMALFAAGAVGYVIANNASISGAEGGCQAEVGSATAMAASAACELAGGSPAQCAEALAIALKNQLGLACDPVAGLVEVPCIKRNAAGASLALTAADMALAGIASRIPADEVILAMYQIGQSMPLSLKETALGGLAQSKTALKIEESLQNNTQLPKL